MQVKIKKLHGDAVLPFYSKPGDAGLDLVAVESTKTIDGCYVYKTGIAIEIPEGYVGLLFPRSSISSKSMQLTNCVGVIDSGYRGEVMLKFKMIDKGDAETGEQLPIDYRDLYQPGDKVGQLIIMPYPKIELEWAEELSDTERGEGGYGSTGA